MVFPEDVLRQAWAKSGGRCECRRITHGHAGRCNHLLLWENRGKDCGGGSWGAHQRISAHEGGDASLENCEILCWHCFSRTHEGLLYLQKLKGESLAAG